MADQETRTELNRLYWESDDPVSAIADRLGLSRRALYDDIEPLPAGAPCPECGGPLAFRNRTTAEAREAECGECGTEVSLDGASFEPDPGVEQEHRAAPLSPTRRVPEAGSGVVLGALLLVGLGLGALAAYLLRRT